MFDRRWLWFHVLLLWRSGRWAGPALVYVVWAMMAFRDPGTALSNASTLFTAHLVAGCWLMIVIGNIDDGGHRELIAAIVGGGPRLHVLRAVSGLLIAVALAATTTGLIYLLSPNGGLSPREAVAVMAVEVSGALLGMGVGTLFHRPLVRHIGYTVVVPSLILVLVLLIPALQVVLRNFNDNSTQGAFELLGVAMMVWATATATAANLVRYSRSLA